MNEAEYKGLQQTGWCRKLTPAEAARLQAWLALHPDQQRDWDAEAGLNQLLGQLRDAPVASNFTARVLQELARESAPVESALNESGSFFPRGRLREWLSRWVRRPAAGLAWAAALMIAGWAGYHQFSKPSGQAHDLAVLFKTVGQVPALFEDFDAIHKLPLADDEELYAVLSVQP